MEMLTNNELLMKYYPFIEELKLKWKMDDDCLQIFCVDFLQYNNEKLNKIDQRNEMKFFIVRWLKNEWFSSTSKYYTTYHNAVNRNTIDMDTYIQTYEEYESTEEAE